MKNQTSLPKCFWVVATILIILFIGSCRFKIGKTGGAPGSLLKVPFTVLDTTDCNMLLSVQGAFCFSDTSVFNFIEAIPTDTTNWIFNYNVNNHAFTLFTLTPDGIPVSPGDTLFYLLLQLKPQGNVGDYSRIGLCNNILATQVGCIDATQNVSSSYDYLLGRIEIQDFIDFGGKVRSIESPNEGTDMVDINFSSDYTTLMASTDTTGDYAFTEVLSGHYQAFLARTIRSENMYSAFGLVSMARHIAGIQDLTPYYLLAADVDCDQDLDFEDVYLYNDVLLGFESSFDSCEGWLFVPEDHVFSDPLEPFGIPEGWPINIFSDTSDINFISIEKGILPGSYPQPLNSPAIDFDLEIQREGTQVQVAFRSTKDLELSAFQLALDYNPAELVFQKGQAEAIPALYFSERFSKEGLIPLNSFHPQGEDFFITKGSVLFQLTFKAKNQSVDLQKSIRIDRLMLPSLAYDHDGNAFEISFQQRPELAKVELQSKSSFEVQNYPNPFRDQTTFQFQMETAGKAELLIYNVQGILVGQLKENFEAGQQQFFFQNPGLATGIYYYSLHQNGKVMSRSMQILN